MGTMGALDRLEASARREGEVAMLDKVVQRLRPFVKDPKERGTYNDAMLDVVTALSDMAKELEAS